MTKRYKVEERTISRVSLIRFGAVHGKGFEPRILDLINVVSDWMRGIVRRTRPKVCTRRICHICEVAANQRERLLHGLEPAGHFKKVPRCTK